MRYIIWKYIDQRTYPTGAIMNKLKINYLLQIYNELLAIKNHLYKSSKLY